MRPGSGQNGSRRGARGQISSSRSPLFCPAQACLIVISNNLYMIVFTGAALIKNLKMKIARFLCLCGFIYLNLILASCGWAQSTVIQPSHETQPDARALSSFPPATMTSSRRKWETILQQIHPQIGEKTIRMDRLIGQLRRAGLPVILDETARDDSLDEDESVSLDLPGEPLRARLNQTLKRHNAVLAILGDRLLIISLDVANDPEYFSTVSYDVTSLAVEVDSLIDTIKYSITPDGWDDTNGDASILSTVINDRKVLTLAAPYQTHVQVRSLLRELYRLTGGTRHSGYGLANATPGMGSRVITLPTALDSYSRRQNQGRGMAGRRRGRGVGVGGFGGGGGVF